MSLGEITWPDVGDLQRRVAIKHWVDTANAGFSIDQTFDAGISRWAKFEPIIGSAFWGAEQVGEKPTHRIWVRYGTGTKPENLTGQYVVDWTSGNQRFRIIRATNVGDAQKFTMLDCKLLGPIA